MSLRAGVVALVASLPLAAAAQVYKCPRPSGPGYGADPCPGGERLTLDSPVEKLRDKAALDLLYNQSKTCADLSTMLHMQGVAKKTTAQDIQDQAVAGLFRKDCAPRGFNVPTTADIHRANHRRHEENRAKMRRAAEATLPPAPAKGKP